MLCYVLIKLNAISTIVYSMNYLRIKLDENHFKCELQGGSVTWTLFCLFNSSLFRGRCRTLSCKDTPTPIQIVFRCQCFKACDSSCFRIFWIPFSLCCRSLSLDQIILLSLNFLPYTFLRCFSFPHLICLWPVE